MPAFSQADMDRLAGPHVMRAWFLVVDLPAGMTYLHNGAGRKTIAGQEYRGVTDPAGGQLVGIESVEDPRFGQAAAVSIALSGANKAFLQSVHSTAAAIEGRAATLYWATFDGETEEIIGGLVKMFPGFMTSPKISWQGIGMRAVTIVLVSEWEGQNFPFGGRWTESDQQRRYPGDRGLQYVGVEVQEIWK